MKRPACLLLTLILSAAAGTGYCANTAGTATAGFLKLPSDARSAGMGEAVAGAARGPMALFQNPAGLAGNWLTGFSFSHALLVEDISYDAAGAAVPLGKAGVVGLGVQYLSYGSMASLDNAGAAAGNLSPVDSAYSLGWGYNIDEDIKVGAVGKYIDSKIYGSAASTAMELGLLISGEDLSLGLAAQNMGKGLKFNKESSPLPVNVRLGINITSRTNWEWAADLNFPKDGSAWLAAGGEYAVEMKSAWTLYLRAGYNTAALDTGGINGISAGFGLARRRLALDYAFKAMGDLGATHHLGLTCRW